MKIEIKEIPTKKIEAKGLEISWQDGQFVMIITEKGIISCGILDMEVANKFNFLATVSRGTIDCPLTSTEDLLAAKILEVSHRAKEYGIEVGITAKEALKKIDEGE